jgi:hypothetical protein
MAGQTIKMLARLTEKPPRRLGNPYWGLMAWNPGETHGKIAATVGQILREKTR